MPVHAKKTQLYDNDQVLHPDGSLLFFCNRKKSNWYLARELADRISETPHIIRLKFNPAGPGQQGDLFYLQARDNICAVCGSKENLSRHHVVPHCYRKFLHEEKNHSYHDILPVCTTDHDRYEKLAFQLKQQIAVEFDAPIHGIFDKEKVTTLRNARSAARVLLTYGIKIPEDRKEFLLKRVYNVFENTLNLKEISQIDIDSDTVTHGKIVVEKLNDVQSFFERWRNHFVSTMQPKFLPSHWNIQRKEK